MVFSSREKGEGDHNIFICTLQGETWSRPQEIKEINTEFNEETPFISHDGAVILFASDRPGSMKPSRTSKNVDRTTFDIYYSQKNQTGWGPARPLPGDVNTIHNERAPALSMDGRTVYFTRWPYKSLHRSRIMKATLGGEAYVNAEELPEPVNTGNYDMALREAPDGMGFYFSSMRRGGFGGWDIYYVSHSRGVYGSVKNLGPLINSEGHELFYTITPRGAYFCSNRPDGLGRYDIYVAQTSAPAASTAPQPERAHPTPPPARAPVEAQPRQSKTRLTFTILDEKTGSPLSMKFRVYLKNSDDPAAPALRSIVRQSDARGRFTLVPRNDVTHVMVAPEDHASIALQSVRVEPNREKAVSIVISRPAAPAMPEQRKALPGRPATPPGAMKKIDEGETAPGSLSLQNILFDANSVNIGLEYYPFIHNLIDHLRRNPAVRLLIIGHADRRGNEESNETLSRNRAMAVRDYLVRMGIEESRIGTRGEGDRKPLVRDRHYSQANRRVEFRLR
jgi:outer membrane protein OmpA-like peptidoglycan-associated protein